MSMALIAACSWFLWFQITGCGACDPCFARRDVVFVMTDVLFSRRLGVTLGLRQRSREIIVEMCKVTRC